MTDIKDSSTHVLGGKLKLRLKKSAASALPRAEQKEWPKGG